MREGGGPEVAPSGTLLVHKPVFEGRHDFASFCENPEGQESTLVAVEKSGIENTGPEILYRVTASHYLWKMVRRLTGTLVEVGSGHLDEPGVRKLLNAG